MSMAQRDDTLPRQQAIIDHFKRNMIIEALELVRQAFSVAWSAPITIKDPTEFEVSVWFDRVLPDAVVQAIESELAEHGWTNYVLTPAYKTDCSTATHHLLAKIDVELAHEYAR